MVTKFPKNSGVKGITNQSLYLTAHSQIYTMCWTELKRGNLQTRQIVLILGCQQNPPHLESREWDIPPSSLHFENGWSKAWIWSNNSLLFRSQGFSFRCVQYSGHEKNWILDLTVWYSVPIWMAGSLVRYSCNEIALKYWTNQSVFRSYFMTWIPDGFFFSFEETAIQIPSLSPFLQ